VILFSTVSGISGKKSNEINVDFQVNRALCSSTEYVMLRYFILEKIFPATAADIPSGLPEEIAVVTCVTVFAAVPAFWVVSMTFFVVVETGARIHCL